MQLFALQSQNIDYRVRVLSLCRFYSSSYIRFLIRRWYSVLMIAQRIESFARYGALTAVAIEWLSLLGFYISNPSNFSGQYPLSYFATIPQTRLIFSICYTLAALSFWIFVKYHLNRHYQTPTKMFTLSMLGFAAVAIIPFSFNDPLTSTIHNLSALFFSVTFIAGMYLISRTNGDKQVKVVSGAMAAFSTIFLVLFMSSRENSHLILLFEAGSGLVCQLWMIWISLHIFRKSHAQH
jgi:hypothetical protein